MRLLKQGGKENLKSDELKRYMIQWLVRNCENAIGKKIGYCPFDEFNRNGDDEQNWQSKDSYVNEETAKRR